MSCEWGIGGRGGGGRSSLSCKWGIGGGKVGESSWSCAGGSGGSLLFELGRGEAHTQRSEGLATISTPHTTPSLDHQQPTERMGGQRRRWRGTQVTHPLTLSSKGRAAVSMAAITPAASASILSRTMSTHALCLGRVCVCVEGIQYKAGDADAGHAMQQRMQALCLGCVHVRL